MKNIHDEYALGLHLSHLALLRNLDAFVRFAAEPPSPDAAGDFADFIAIYADFLDVHHDAEEEDLFPALRRSSAGKSTDAAHLDRWSSEHRLIHELRQALSRDAGQVRSGATNAFRELHSVSLDLMDLLTPHFRSEEDILSSQHLREMISEAALTEVQRASARKNRGQALRLATFLVHSLDPSEQRALMGDTPWVFRKIALGLVGERRMERFRPFVHTPTLAL